MYQNCVEMHQGRLISHLKTMLLDSTWLES